MDVYVKTVKVRGEVLVAACDADVLGKTYEEDDLHLEVTDAFYCGEIMSIDECSRLFEEATILNIVGENVVKKACDLGIVNPVSVLKIGKTVHAQMVRL